MDSALSTSRELASPPSVMPARPGKTLAVIPARSGSKSIPNKNLRKFADKPLIAWTIDTATKSRASRVAVTTDGEEIRQAAVHFGAEVPYLRPAELAGDETAIEPVLIDLLDYLRASESYSPDCVLLLMPTSPFRRVDDIDRAIDLFFAGDATSVVSVSRAVANHNPHWMLRRSEGGGVVLFDGQPLTAIKNRRQELPEAYIRNDFVYALDPANLYAEKPGLYGAKPELMVVEDDRIDVDINGESDWKIAELIFKAAAGPANFEAAAE